MKPLILALLLLLSFSCTQKKTVTDVTLLDKGRQPQVAVDAAGTTRIVYGMGDKIYCATSSDNGNTFSNPVLIAQLPGLYLGMSMGPQVASSGNFTVVTAIDKKGNIHTYSLNHGADVWKKAARVNDVPGSVPEGLMSLTADEKDTFYAVWLDVRKTNTNKIVLATASGEALAWSANKVVYESPDSTVCECCKPSIAVHGKKVALMFRNWLNGARDFYVTTSTNGGQTFESPEKVGKGTWKLEGCPMDGGSLLLDSQNVIHTSWQRDGKIFYAKPGEPEQQLGEGRHCRLNVLQAPVITWQNENTLFIKRIGSTEKNTIGQGSYLETAQMPDKKLLCVWEHENKIFFRKI